MPDLKTSVSLTSSSMDKLSRHDMLDWVNSTVNGQYKKIEDLCSGIAYCQIMELLFPNCIGLKKVKTNAKMEHEFLHNLKLFQSAFLRLNFDKSVPIDRLLKGRFQDNFEFLQWFKKFFDTHAGGKENLRVPAALAAAAANAPKPIRKPGAAPLSSGCGVGTGKPKTTSTPPTQSLNTTPKSDKRRDERAVSPSSLLVLQESQQQLLEQISSIENERNYYFKKLTDIEALLNESAEKNEHVDWCKRTLAILYATDEDNAVDVEPQPESEPDLFRSD